MAEDYEAYHVPQQSRREKLRVVVQSNLQGCSGLLPLYDPSLLSSDLLTCADLHQQNNHPLGGPCRSSSEQAGGAKEEAVNLMGYGGGVIHNACTCSSSTTSHHLYVDPQSSIQLNPSSMQDVNNSPFLYTSQRQSLRVFDQPFDGGGGVVLYKAEVPLSIAQQPSTTTGQVLSLSLSSDHTHQTNLPLELNLQRYESSSVCSDKVSGGYGLPGIFGGGSTSNNLPRSLVPLGPFTGYASILKGSRFLRPAQQLLDELCDVGRVIYAQKLAADSAMMDPPPESLGGSGIPDDPNSCRGGEEQQQKKSRLISMLDEVYRRYKQYYQQTQAVVASFECVAGLSNAAPFANLALKVMSKHFRCLKNAITDRLQFTNKSHSHIDYGKDESPICGNHDRGLYGQRPLHNSGLVGHQPIWRPQRGLPERAVTVLRAWLFEHFLHPYPTDTDKLMLAKQTGLSRNQVSNWFINARVRLWKPMVEEIHMLETRQVQKASHGVEQNAQGLNDLPAANSLENPSTSNQRIQDLTSKRTRNDFPDIPVGSEGPMNLSYENLSQHPQLGAGMSTAGGNGGVSLTLGLHQNNGIALSEPFPMNAARRFGLDTNSQEYALGGFEAGNQQFGRNIIGGQLLHDFVG